MAIKVTFLYSNMEKVQGYRMCVWLQAELDKISLDKVRKKAPGPAMLHHKEIFSYQSRQQAIVAPLAVCSELS